MNAITVGNEKIADALKLLEEAAREKKDELQSMFKGKYGHLKDALVDTEEDVVKTLSAAKKQALKAALHAKDVGTERAMELAEELDEKVHENPWPYIGGAALGALLIGYILGRK